MSIVDNKIANIVWFQIGWFAAIVWQQQAWFILLLLLLTWCYQNRQNRQALILMTGFACYGILFDTMLLHLGILEFSEAGYFVPLWLGLLWFIFAGTLRCSLLPIFNLNRLYVLIGGIFGCLSYIAGMKLGAVSFPLTLTMTIPILILIWCGHFYVFKQVIDWANQRAGQIS